MKVLSSYEMKLSDEQTILENKITPLILMGKASKACFDAIIDNNLIPDKTKTISIVCYHSNNSGDGFGLAGLLLKAGYNNTRIYFVGSYAKMNDNVKGIYNHFKNLGSYTIDVDKEDLNFFKNTLKDSDVIIDAIIGTGLNGRLRDGLIDVVNAINQSDALKISIDIPTGVNSDTGNIHPVAVKSDYTLVIQAFKYGNLLSHGIDCCGKFIIVDAGITIPSDLKTMEIIDNAKVKKAINNRKRNSNKYDYGSVLTIGSNENMVGAGILASYAAIKSGCGLSTLTCDEFNFRAAQLKAPFEIMVSPFHDDVNQLEALLKKKNIIIFGPGMGKNSMYTNVLKYLLKQNVVLIVDADGLTHLRNVKDDIKNKVASLVITPHTGEAAMLLNVTTQEVTSDLITSAKRLHERYDCHVILKGFNTYFLSHKGNKYLNITGNAGMATAGSGDVLSGIIAGLCAQGGIIEEKIALALYLHGLSGDIAKEELGEECLTASDLITYLPKAFKLMNSYK